MEIDFSKYWKYIEIKGFGDWQIKKNTPPKTKKKIEKLLKDLEEYNEKISVPHRTS